MSKSSTMARIPLAIKEEVDIIAETLGDTFGNVLPIWASVNQLKESKSLSFEEAFDQWRQQELDKTNQNLKQAETKPASEELAPNQPTNHEPQTLSELRQRLGRVEVQANANTRQHVRLLVSQLQVSPPSPHDQLLDFLEELETLGVSKALLEDAYSLADGYQEDDDPLTIDIQPAITPALGSGA